MHIPIYVVTGFLDAGKTTFLKKLLNNREMWDVQILVLQFESGEEEFHSRYRNCEVMNFPKGVLEQNSNQIIEQIHGYLLENPVDEIWIEWNGITPFAKLQALFLHRSLYRHCRIEKVIHMADAPMLEGLLGKTGGALPEQIANCDFAVVRGVRSDKEYYHVRRMMHGINPGVKVYETNQSEEIYDRVYHKKARPVNALCSSSDAVIARSFASRFPLGAIMGFLVFGPMMDIKNVIMLSSGFSKRFIWKLLTVTFTVCFLTIFLLARLAIGGGY